MRWFYLVTLFFSLLTSFVITEAASASDKESNPCENMAIQDITLKMNRDTIRSTLIQNGFTVKDIDGHRTGKMVGTRKEGAKATKFTFVRKETISAQITIDQLAKYMPPIISDRVVTFCGEMGEGYYKEHNGAKCSVKETHVSITYSKKVHFTPICTYSFEAWPNYYSESLSTR